MPVYNPVLQLLRGGGGVAYKSMSWSTSRRERAKLGRLDSEPPLLLREWPPETGRRNRRRGEGARRIKAEGGGGGREAEEQGSQEAHTAVKEGVRMKERGEKERAEFTHLLLVVFNI